MKKRIQRQLPYILMAAGFGIILIFGTRACRAARRLPQIQADFLAEEAADSEAIRGWMTLRFVAVAYAVPEEYLYDALGISFEQRPGDVPLDRLNRQYDFGRSAQGDYPAILDTVHAAVEAYYANPVAPGLDDIRSWMSVRYIANSTGVPEAYLLDQLGLPLSDAIFPLREVARRQAVEGGPQTLVTAVETALAAYQAAEE